MILANRIWPDTVWLVMSYDAGSVDLIGACHCVAMSDGCCMLTSTMTMVGYILYEAIHGAIKSMVCSSKDVTARTANSRCIGV